MAGSRARSFVVLLAAAVLLLCTGLGATDFWAPDEPRYGQIAEELRSLDHGAAGMVLLHIGGEPYTQKPPLYYWLAAAFGALPGRVTEAAARLPSALAGVACVALVFVFARRLFPVPAGGSAVASLLAGAFLLTSFRFAHLARRAQLDVLLTLFETAALYAFWRLETDPGPKDRRRIAALHGALGAAALTKGPVGWLPLLVAAAYLAWERRLGDLRRIVPPWSLLLSVAPVVAWIAAATALAPEGFFGEAVVDNLLGRVLAAESHVRPLYYYLYQLPADFLPWTLLLPLALAWGLRTRRRQGRLPPPWRLLACWVVVPLIVFSLASGKRGLYLLPTFPALAMMVAGAVQSWLDERGALPRVVPAALAAIGTTLFGAAAFVAFTSGARWPWLPSFGMSGPAAATLAAVAGTGLLAAPWVARRRPGTGALETAVAVVLALELTLFLRVLPENDAEKSPRPVAREVAALVPPGEVVGVFDDEGLAGGILYYGGRKPAVLARAPNVAAFLEGGGRYVVLERWKLPWLAEVGSFRVHATTRAGVRELAVVTRERPGPQARRGHRPSP